MRFGPGKRLGSYEILSPIGAGGMGEVYRARDLKLDREVAIKVLSADLASDAAALGRFEREAKALAALSHPHVLGVYDFGCEGSDWYFVTELLEGVTLRDRMQQGRVPLGKCFEWAIAIAQGLAAAHAKGLVHRDLKPENVFITSSGIVKVLDFGVARLSAPEQPGATVTAATPIATPGMVVGSPAYMSPEQAQGQTVDHRSDIFAFGTLLYELVTGRHPFRDTSTLLTLQKIIEIAPPPIEAAPGMPPQLEWIAGKCLAKNPDERYQATSDVVVDLQATRRQIESGAVTPITTPAHPPRARRRGLAIAAAVIVIVIAAAIYGVFGPGRRTPAPLPISIRPLTSSGNVIDAVLSPDGKYLAYVESFEGMQSLWLKQTTTSSVIQVVAPAAVGFWGITFSPDGSSIYYALKSAALGGGGTLFQVPALGGAPKRLLSGIDSVVTFSPDGSRLSYLRADFPRDGESSVMVASADGSGEGALTTRKVPAVFAPGFFLSTAWSRDGRIIYAPLRDARSLSATIVALNSTDGREMPFPFPADRFLQIAAVRVLPDDALVFVGANRVGASLRLGAGAEQVWILPKGTFDPQPISNDLSSYRAVGTTADGRVISAVAMTARSSAWELNADGTDARRISSSGFAGVNSFSVAPDGRLVFSSIESGTTQIWSMAADGADRQQLTTTALNSLPTVSPDGRTIVYLSSRANGIHLWRMDADGGGQKQLESIGATSFAAFSRDGRWLVFPSLASGTETLWRIPAQGGEPRQLTKSYSVKPAISPDGTRIACLYRRTATATTEIAIVPLDGGEPLKTFPGTETQISMVKWAADGRALIHTAGGRRETLYVQPLDAPMRTLVHYPEEQIFNFDVTPDGRIFVRRGILSRDAVTITNFR